MAKKVLIVEDENNIAELLHLYLEKEGFKTSVAHDGLAGMVKQFFLINNTCSTTTLTNKNTTPKIM